MGADRITQLLLGGMRCVDEIRLDLGAFTVLIGENGAGKSTIVEASELLRKVATESPFVEKLYQPHNGTRLVRAGATHLRLGARIEGAGPPLLYQMQVLRDGTYLSIQTESCPRPTVPTGCAAREARLLASGADGKPTQDESPVLSSEAVLYPDAGAGMARPFPGHRRAETRRDGGSRVPASVVRG